MAVIKVSDVKNLPPIVKITSGRSVITHKVNNNQVILNKPVV